jgi:hypothetical protein
MCGLLTLAFSVGVGLAVARFGRKRIGLLLLMVILRKQYILRRFTDMALKLVSKDIPLERKVIEGVWTSIDESYDDEAIAAMSDEEFDKAKPAILKIACSVEKLQYQQEVSGFWMNSMMGGDDDPRAALKNKGKRQVNVDYAEQQRVISMARAKHILMDWMNIEFQEGSLPPTLENKLRLMKDYPQYRQFVDNFSAKIENYTAGSEYDPNRIGGKSVTTSSGKPTTLAA